MVGTLTPAVEGLNPARRSSELEALFPAGVVGAELSGEAPAGLLTASELNAVSHCAAKRISDFSAGRLCARRALEAFGLTNVSLLPAPDRLPMWPEAFTGSITHTEGYSAAVVTRRGTHLSLGVDSEAIVRVHPELWPRVLGAAELEHVHALPEDSRGTVAALRFAAKEAFYKSQYPLTGEWLEFEDIRIESGDWHLGAGRFSVHPQRPLRLQERIAAPLVGRFRVHGGFVSCGVALGR